MDKVIAALDEMSEAALDAPEQRDPLHGGDRRRLESDQARALSHPVRIDVLSLFTRDPTRSLGAADLVADLAVEDPDAFGEFTVAQVAYHHARLQDAKLLPAERY